MDFRLKHLHIVNLFASRVIARSPFVSECESVKRVLSPHAYILEITAAQFAFQNKHDVCGKVFRTRFSAIGPTPKKRLGNSPAARLRTETDLPN